ncbi:hypothetical protein W911_15570 [Hyphomicrobium nitrativorans NL23]|uniref:Sodium:solute symporter n=1 Tax=Hyphomicrobium nitrativorans NL23 TaxID=1029756 RepID=V5SJW4_9HYPH|nr:hypothetical protein [Hyphomicrobium nitrativorans]AHB50385.1 hypothetical protein W911_15570 [Hyphomicrobium nitrativorans NL23]
MNGTVFPGLSAAGRALPVALLAALPGLVFAAGYDHLAYGVGLLAGVVLAGLLIAPRLAEAAAPTISSAIREKFGAVAARLASALVALVAMPLLAADFALAGLVFERGLGIAPVFAVLAMLALVVLLGLMRDARTLAVLSAAAWLLLAASIFVPLVLIAFVAEGGATLPVTAYGLLMQDLQGVEETLIERGLVDFDTFSAHAAPFIRLIERDVFALVVTLTLGIAALPHLASTLAQTRNPAVTRFAGAWAALFVMILMLGMPALAVYAKHAIYSAIANDTPLASLPHWLEAPLAAGVAHVHGTSLHLFEQVASAAQAGSRTAAAVADAISAGAGSQWQALDPDVQQVMFAAATQHALDPQAFSAWEVYRGTVLPAAAAVAGNDGAILMQSGLVIEPLGFLLIVAGLTGFPAAVLGLMALAFATAALAVSASLVRAVANAVPDRADGRVLTFPGIMLALAVSVIAVGAAVFVTMDLVTLVVSALAIAAAGLFPALALGLAWRRATAAGVIAAMIAGAGVSGYYTAATQLFPVAFYTTWPTLSNASEYAIEEFETLTVEAREAETGAERTQAAAALEDLARGSATRAGLANWAGIDSPSSGIFGVLAGLVALILVSLVTPSRRGRAQP